MIDRLRIHHNVRRRIRRSGVLHQHTDRVGGAASHVGGTGVLSGELVVPGSRRNPIGESHRTARDGDRTANRAPIHQQLELTTVRDIRGASAQGYRFADLHCRRHRAQVDGSLHLLHIDHGTHIPVAEFSISCRGTFHPRATGMDLTRVAQHRVLGSHDERISDAPQTVGPPQTLAILIKVATLVRGGRPRHVHHARRSEVADLVQQVSVGVAINVRSQGNDIAEGRLRLAQRPRDCELRNVTRKFGTGDNSRSRHRRSIRHHRLTRDKERHGHRHRAQDRRYAA